MRLSLRKYEVAMIRQLISERVDQMRGEGANPNSYRLMALLDKRIMRQEDKINKLKTKR